MSEIFTGHIVRLPDGSMKFFDTKAEAQAFIRQPKVLEALNKLFGDSPNPDLAKWLLDNQEALEDAFDTGTIRRVSKPEKNQLAKAAEYLRDRALGNPEKKIDPDFALAKGAKFIIENLDTVVSEFRWPKVARLKEEEKAAAIAAAVGELTKDDEGTVNEDLTNWIVSAQEGILEAFQAGVEKRPVNPGSGDVLAGYRFKKAVKGLRAAQAGDDAEKLTKAQASYEKAKAVIPASEAERIEAEVDEENKAAN